MKLMTEKSRLKTGMKQVSVFWHERRRQSEEVVERRERREVSGLRRSSVLSEVRMWNQRVKLESSLTKMSLMENEGDC